MTQSRSLKADIAQLLTKYQDNPSEDLSLLEILKRKFKGRPKAFQKYLDGLSEDQWFSLKYDIEYCGRQKQQLPEGDWDTWLLQPGRGFGKTWTGAKVVNYWAKHFPNELIVLIGKDIGEVRDSMMEGDSGIIAQADPRFTPTFNKKEMKLVWPNGATAVGISGETPEDMRRLNAGKAWVDELFKIKKQRDVWEQLGFIMRVGKNPQVVLTSTPRSTALCKAIAEEKSTVITNGTTFENYSTNEKFKAKMQRDYGGTRLGQQELLGIRLDDNPKAIFFLKHIEDNRQGPPADELQKLIESMDRIVVAVDPAVSSNENSDDTGIAVCGRRGDEGFLFHSAGIVETPSEWAKEVAELYKQYEADKVIGEINQGGDLVEANIRTANKFINYKGVRAFRGKALRAEPIGALYEQGRIHHVGEHNRAEAQMTSFDPTLSRTQQKSPDLMDAIVYGFTELFGEDLPGMPVLILLGD